MPQRSSDLSLIRAQPRILRRLGREANPGDLAFRVLAGLFAGVVLLALVVMAVQMTRASTLSLSTFGLGFITSQDWDPVRDQYGAAPFIYGTLVSSFLSLLIAVP